MIPSHENPLAFKAGAFSVLIHLALLAAMLISFNTQTSQIANVAQVELWDSLPKTVVQPHLVKEVPKPLIKEELKEEPKDEPKSEPMVEKADIEIKKKSIEKTPPKPVEKKIVEKPKPDLAIEKEKEKQKRDAALKALQNDVTEDTTASDRKAQVKAIAAALAADDAQVSAAANNKALAGEIDKYRALIQAKIQRNVNKQLCGMGNPTLEFGIVLMPTGEVSGTPKKLKSSGTTACDDAVERAILQSQPLPLPPDGKLFSQFRDLRLKFHPNDSN